MSNVLTACCAFENSGVTDVAAGWRKAYMGGIIRGVGLRLGRGGMRWDGMGWELCTMSHSMPSFRTS